MPTLSTMIAQAPPEAADRLKVDDAAFTRAMDKLSDHAVTDEVFARFVASLCSCSPFCARLLDRVHDDLIRWRTMTVEEIEEELLAGFRLPADTAMAQSKPTLRQARSAMGFAVALLDVAEIWPVQKVVNVLTACADEAVSTAFSCAWHACRMRTGLTDRGFERAGMAVFAMGKQGAGELNYSSDIDLVIFYDPSRFQDEPRYDRAVRQCVQMAVDILNDQTADGFVFRTDLRLRPDPGATGPAVSIQMAESYYERSGQNWERAAFIKARPVCGDPDTINKTRSILAPFIWRRYLDYAAIADIHAIKRQIHAVKGGQDFEFAGHDVKLGRGGIREIEFFVQTQQLILGGKDEDLRDRPTLDVLSKLADRQVVSAEDAAALRAGYLFLRHVEHRIQMINDEQSHTVPKTPEEQYRLARFAGFSSVEAFREKLTRVLTEVHDIYADLFETEEPLSTVQGSLVFTGVEDDAETLKTLVRLGFQDPAFLSGRIRHWQASGIRATRSARAREILTRLVPTIVVALSKAEDPDGAARGFDDFISALPAGVQSFSLIEQYPDIIQRLVQLVDMAPRFARVMAGRPDYVEALLEQHLVGDASLDDHVNMDLDSLPAVGTGFEAAMDDLRRAANAHNFNLCCQILLSHRPISEIEADFTRAADIAVDWALEAARRDMAAAHGDIAGELVVLGFGRLGTHTLTSRSDLDIVFVYDAPADAVSDGVKALDAPTWYTRMVRRLITFLSANTAEGGLYDVDMALRPSGGAGPAVVTLEAFEQYYANDAWTWEEMALTKARPVNQVPGLTAALRAQIASIIARPRDRDGLVADVRSMRQRLLDDKPPRTDWDVKRVHGGLTDVEFIAQFLTLLHGTDLAFTADADDWRGAPMALSLHARRGYIDPADATFLHEAWHLFDDILAYVRVCREGPFDLGDARQAELQGLLRRTGEVSVDLLHQRLDYTAARVREIFSNIVC